MSARFPWQRLRNPAKSVVQRGYRHYLTRCSRLPRRGPPDGPRGGGAVHPMLSVRPRRGEGAAHSTSPPDPVDPHAVRAASSRRHAVTLHSVTDARDAQATPVTPDASDDVAGHMVVDARQAVDSLPDGVVIADQSGIVRLVNDRAATLLGTTRDVAEGRPLADVLTISNQDGASWVSCTEPYGGLVTRTGVPEQSWITPSGQEVLV